jgi:hypothetical protein
VTNAKGNDRPLSSLLWLMVTVKAAEWLGVPDVPVTITVTC